MLVAAMNVRKKAKITYCTVVVNYLIPRIIRILGSCLILLVESGQSANFTDCGSYGDILPINNFWFVASFLEK